MMHFEDKSENVSIRVLLSTLSTQPSIFIPSGPEKFHSTCSYGTCPCKIISHSYPYRWETNSCTNIDVGYRIYPNRHRDPQRLRKMSSFDLFNKRLPPVWSRDVHYDCLQSL
ncbi:unnamed protein product [Pocillopora meandrina]|uniref:Uncharacterized protein n=1 Tax=Pocillopora meandrina TaxID=46732 RepID=A0AAU9VJM0_9CNID|nr:unnamed protein product [Pocillopora meandrina]